MIKKKRKTIKAMNRWSMKVTKSKSKSPKSKTKRTKKITENSSSTCSRLKMMKWMRMRRKMAIIKLKMINPKMKMIKTWRWRKKFNTATKTITKKR